MKNHMQKVDSTVQACSTSDINSRKELKGLQKKILRKTTSAFGQIWLCLNETFQDVSAKENSLPGKLNKVKGVIALSCVRLIMGDMGIDQRMFKDCVKFIIGHFKSTVERYKTYCGMFRGKIKSGERERTIWIWEKQECTKEKDHRKGHLHVAGQYFHPVPTTASHLNSLLSELCEHDPCSLCGHDPPVNFNFTGPS